jgi:hypothetical protein
MSHPYCVECYKDDLANETACSLLRAWKIEPCGQTGIDALYMLDDGRWSGVMGQVEYALEQQMESDDGGGKMERPWNEISATITGVLLTPEEWGGNQR